MEVEPGTHKRHDTSRDEDGKFSQVLQVNGEGDAYKDGHRLSCRRRNDYGVGVRVASSFSSIFFSLYVDVASKMAYL
jgi:hypothetical protein